MLVRLLKRPELEAEAAPKPLPPTLVSIPCPEPPSRTVAQNRSPKRRRKRARVCRLYPQTQTETRMHARALLAFIQEHCDDAAGGYVPACDLLRFYEQDLCQIKGWTARHWTGIARQLGTLTHKRSIRQNGRRLVGYQIPRP